MSDPNPEEDISKQLLEKLDQQPESDIRISPDNLQVYNLDGTKTSKKADQIELKLSKKLQSIVKQLRENPLLDTTTIDRYNVIVNETIRSAVQDSYELGIRYVASYYKVSGYITTADLEQIKNNTDEYVSQFWIRYQKYVAHRNDVLEQKRNYAPRNPLSDEFIVTSLATVLVTGILNLATILKVNQIEDRNNIMSEDIYRVAQTGVQRLLVWKARNDEMTCFYCSTMNGRTWEYNKPDLPIPPHNSHPHCRCRIMILDTDIVATLIPPEQE